MNAATFYPIFRRAENVVIDSRKVRKGDVFFAFSGENFNAAEKAESALEQGAIAVIVEDKDFENSAKNIFFVSSTLRFLQDLAGLHRKQLRIPIIGLTGSNGKTTTKEIMHAVLAQKFRVKSTIGNLNNHIGVPLTLLSIKPEDEIAVVEMGANHQGEIAALCEIAQPTIGYITNFGKAHLEGFGGLQGVIKGKSELFDYLMKNSGTILVNEKDAIQQEKSAIYTRKITFGSQDSDYHFEETSQDNFVGLCYKNQTAQSNLTGSYNFTNLCAAATLGLHFQIEFSHIKTAIESYNPTNMRSQILQKAGKTLVLDTYNANPSSMAESLKNFSKFEGTKTVIIGDMLELGAESEAEHQAILDFAGALGFDQVITVGTHFGKCTGRATSFANSAELATYLQSNRLPSKNILLKASRGIALENVLEFIA